MISFWTEFRRTAVSVFWFAFAARYLAAAVVMLSADGETARVVAGWAGWIAVAGGSVVGLYSLAVRFDHGPAGDGPLVRTGQGDYTRDWPEGGDSPEGGDR